MKLGLESVRYTMREGHFEVAPQFHVSQALLCRYIFSNRDLLAGMAEALIDYFELLERPALLLDAHQRHTHTPLSEGLYGRPRAVA